MKAATKRAQAWVPFVAGIIVCFLFKQDKILSDLETNISAFRYLRDFFYIKLDDGIWYEKIVLYYLSDILWAYSVYWATYNVVKIEIKSALLGLEICVFNEVIQLCPQIEAVFDSKDLILESIAVLVAYLVSIYAKSG